MNIRQAKQEIKDSIEAYLQKDSHGEYEIPVIRQRPMLLMGPPGIGKTQIMEQIARECRIGLVSYTITHHTRQSAIGLPFISKKTYGGLEFTVTEYTMSEIVASVYERIQSTGLSEGILFIDEINCVSETLAPTMLQFLQCKTFGTHQIPEGWIIVTAGNPPEFNKSVREFDMATLDRVKRILVEADYQAFREYAQQAAVHPAVLSYLNVKQNCFYQVETTVDGKIFATPRGWEDLSKLMEVYGKLGKPVGREVVYQYIQHPRIAKDFANYLELYCKYQSDYQVDHILMGQWSEELCRLAGSAPFDEKLSLIGLLLSRLSTAFRELSGTESYLEALLPAVKEFQKRLEESAVPAPKLLDEMAGEHRMDREKKKEAGLLSREENYLLMDVENRLEQYAQSLRLENPAPDQPFQSVRKLFIEESDSFEAGVQGAGRMLEYGFDFMEAAFGDSQEMVIFVTELNTNLYSIHFLRDYDCERYYYYNKKLLFDDREEEMRRKLDEYSGTKD